MADANEVRTLEAIIATLNEVNAALARRHATMNRGSWVMRALGVRDAMETVEAMRKRVIADVVLATAPRAELPRGLTVLTPEEVAARESKPVGE